MRPGTDAFQFSIFYPLGSSLCFALMALLTRIIGEKEKQVTLLFYMIMVQLTFASISIVFQDSWAYISTTDFLILLISAILYMSAMLFMNKAFSMSNTATVIPMQYSQIIWGTIIGYLFFAEIPDKWTIVGAIIIVFSGIYLIYNEKNQQKVEN